MVFSALTVCFSLLLLFAHGCNRRKYCNLTKSQHRTLYGVMHDRDAQIQWPTILYGLIPTNRSFCLIFFHNNYILGLFTVLNSSGGLKIAFRTCTAATFLSALSHITIDISVSVLFVIGVLLRPNLLQFQHKTMQSLCVLYTELPHFDFIYVN